MTGQVIQPAEIAIQPIYTTEHPNDPIILFNECDLELRFPKLLFCKGSVEFRWHPSQSLHFNTNQLNERDTIDSMGAGGKKAILNISTDSSLSLDVIINHQSFGMKAGYGLTSQIGGIADASRLNNDQIDELRFHVANMHQYIGSLITYSTQHSRSRSRIALSDDNWEITIDEVESHKELIKELDREGGFAITHAGKLKHKNGLTFTIAEALEQIKMLGFFLSLVEGRWCCPLLLVGMRNSEIVFSDLSGRNSRIDRWKGNWTWSVNHEAKYLDDAYKGFVRKWNDSKWRRTISIIIEFYIRANTYSVVELSVLDSFMALDQLESAYHPENDCKSGSIRISSALAPGGLINNSLPSTLHMLYETFYKRIVLAKLQMGLRFSRIFATELFMVIGRIAPS